MKGIIEFLEILKKCKRGQEAIVLIAGDEELKESIEKNAHKNRMDVRLFGQKSQYLYAAADIFLLTSLSDPNPLTCIEALWSGLPMFISEHCGNYPEVVKQGENGYVFSYKDKEMAAEMLESIISSSADWRRKAGEISLSIAENMYQSEKAVKRVASEMRELAKK